MTALRSISFKYSYTPSSHLPSGYVPPMDSVHPTSSQEAVPEGIPEGSVSVGTGIPVSSDLQTSQSAAVGTGIPVSSDLQNFQTASEPSGTSSDSESPYNSGDGIRFQDIRVRRRKQKSEGKSLKTPVTDSDSGAVATMGQNPKTPLLKPQIPKDSKIFLWNSGGKKMQFPKDVIPPKKMVIDDITIFVQMLTSDEAKANGVKGWDSVLDDIKGYKPEVAERKIASFWANWRHSRVMARRFKTPKHTNIPLVPTVEAAGTTSSNSPLDPTAEASGSNTTNSKDTPSVDASKRKRTGMPSSAEPHSKKLSYAEAFAHSWPAGPVSAPQPKNQTQTLWVHTHDVERGPISKDYFFEVVSHCNFIKVMGTIQGQADLSWKN